MNNNSNNINEELLSYRYKHYKRQVRDSNVRGARYPFEKKYVSSRRYKNNINKVISDTYNKLDELIDRLINHSADVKEHLRKIYNYNGNTAELRQLAVTESKSPVLSVSADLISMRTAYEYVTAGIEHIDEFNDTNAEHILYKTYVFDSVLKRYSDVVDTLTAKEELLDLQRFAMGIRPGGTEPYRQDIPIAGTLPSSADNKKRKPIDKAKLKRAILWLYRQHMPIDIFDKIHVIRVDRYIDMLRSTMIERMMMVQWYIMKYPIELLNVMRNAKNKVFSPFYRWIMQLPRIPSDADDVLTDILMDINNISAEIDNKMISILHITQLEEYLYNKRVKAVKRLNQQFEFNDTLKDILNKIETFGIDDVIDIIMSERNEVDSKKRRISNYDDSV